MKSLIKNGIVITMDENRKQYEKLDIVFENEKIIYVGEKYTGEVDKTIDASNKIVMPGLINCHTHLGMSLFRATNDDYELNDWLSKKIWPIEDKMNDEDMYYATLLSCVEMIKTGTTCFNDMYFGWKGSMPALIETGVRGIYTRCLMGDNDADGLARIKDFENMLDEYKENSGNITFSIAPHSLYTCTENYLKKCYEISNKYDDYIIHIHLSENEEEVNNIKKSFNKLPVKVLNDLKLLDKRVILAHGNYISDEEIEFFKDKSVSICTNPISNLNLGCGIAPLSKFKDTKINICLGTDGQGSGNNLNLFYHMSFVDYLQKGINKSSTIFSSYDVLKMATINGAKALGYDDLGCIKEGYKADIIILDIDKNIEMIPCIDVIPFVTHNCYCDCVETTIVNGNFLMEERNLNIDISEVDLKRKINEIVDKLWKNKNVL